MTFVSLWRSRKDLEGRALNNTLNIGNILRNAASSVHGDEEIRAFDNGI